MLRTQIKNAGPESPASSTGMARETLGGEAGEERTLSGMITKAYAAEFFSDLDHTLRMSAFGGRTDIFGCGSKSPLIAKNGSLRPSAMSPVERDISY